MRQCTSSARLLLGASPAAGHHLPEQAASLAAELHDDGLATKARKLRDILDSTKGGPSQALSVTAPENMDDDRTTSAEEHWGLGLLAYLRSDFEIAIRHAQACVNIGESFSNPFLVLGGHFVLTMSYASLGHYQIALSHLLHPSICQSSGRPLLACPTVEHDGLGVSGAVRCEAGGAV